MTKTSLLPASILTLFLGMGLLLIGNGLLGTSIGLRASYERYPDDVISVLMALFFSWYCLVGFMLCMLFYGFVSQKDRDSPSVGILLCQPLLLNRCCSRSLALSSP